MNSYICKCCRRPASVVEFPASETSPAYSEIMCCSPGCPLQGVETDNRDEQGIDNRFIVPVVRPALKPTMYPAAPMIRVSERPGSIPARLEDLQHGETMRHLREVLNVEGFIRDLRQIAMQQIAENE